MKRLPSATPEKSKWGLYQTPLSTLAPKSPETQSNRDLSHPSFSHCAPGKPRMSYMAPIYSTRHHDQGDPSKQKWKGLKAYHERLRYLD